MSSCDVSATATAGAAATAGATAATAGAAAAVTTAAADARPKGGLYNVLSTENVCAIHNELSRYYVAFGLFDRSTASDFYASVLRPSCSPISK